MNSKKYASAVAAVALCLAGLAPAQAMQQDADSDWASPAAPSAALLKAADKASWIAEGQGKRVVYIIFDPNCPYCHKLYEEMRPQVGQDGLQFRWMPVGILDASSRGKAAAIIGAKDPLAAFHQNEKDFSREVGFGAIAETVPTTAENARLKTNADILSRAGSPVVPTIMFRDDKGAVRVVQGAPSPDMLRDLLKMVQ